MQSIFNELKGIIQKRKNYLMILMGVYIIGVLVGIFLCRGTEKSLFSHNVVDFFVLVYSKDGNITKLFITRICSAAAFSALFYGLCFIGISVGGHHVLIFYRGYVLGAVAVAFFVGFNVSGIVLFCLCVMIQNAAQSFGLALFSAIMRENNKCGRCQIKDFRYHAIAILICLAICLLAAAVEIIMLFCILRPLNFYF